MTVTTGTERASGVSLSAAMERVAMPRDERGNVVLDHRNRVAVWHLASARWIWRLPIDARELVAMGAATFAPPAGSPPTPEAAAYAQAEQTVDEAPAQLASTHTDPGVPRARRDR